MTSDWRQGLVEETGEFFQQDAGALAVVGWMLDGRTRGAHGARLKGRPYERWVLQTFLCCLC